MISSTTRLSTRFQGNAHTFTPSDGNAGRFTVIPLESACTPLPYLSLSATSFFPHRSHPLILSLSLAGLADLGQNIVSKSTRVKTKRTLALPLPITRIAFDGIPDDGRDRRAMTSRRPYHETKHDVLGPSLCPIQITTDTAFDATKCVFIDRGSSFLFLLLFHYPFRDAAKRA